MMRKEIGNWIVQAEHDLEVAKYNLNGKYFDAVVFYCQQSVEKGLKAVILHKKKEKPISHSLIFLGKLAEVPEEFISKLKKLSPQYFLARYPDASEDVPFELYDENIAKDFFKISEEVLKWISGQLK